MNEFYNRCKNWKDIDVKNLLSSGTNEAVTTKYAIILGIRRCDIDFQEQKQDMKPYVMTDGVYPTFLRIFPLLEFDYGQVWDFLLSLNISYCTLYDRGFTSLGQIHNSGKNWN